MMEDEICVIILLGFLFGFSLYLMFGGIIKIILGYALVQVIAITILVSHKSRKTKNG